MFFLIGQVETATELARKAGEESGWLAMALVTFVSVVLGVFAYMVRGDRVELREINRFVRLEMPDVIDANTVMLARFVARERNCPGLRDSDIDRIAEGNGKLDDKELSELDATARKAVERMQRRAARRSKAEESSVG